MSWMAIYDFVKKFNTTNGVSDLRRAPRPQKLKEIHYRFIDNEMAHNSDLTSRQLLALFKDEFPNVDISLSTIKRLRFELGWVSKRVRYCQLIHEVNKEKRKQWCQERVDNGDLDMDDVIFIDECTVQLECHRKVHGLSQSRSVSSTCTQTQASTEVTHVGWHILMRSNRYCSVYRHHECHPLH